MNAKELLERSKKLHKEAIALRVQSEGLEELRKTLHKKHVEFEKKFAEFNAYFENDLGAEESNKQ